jgi:hypothetical protein
MLFLDGVYVLVNLMVRIVSIYVAMLDFEKTAW